MTIETSKAFYTKLLENMRDGIWMCDKDGKTVYANPHFCEMVEYSLKELKGMTEFDLWDTGSAKKVRKINKQEREKGESSSYEGTLITKSGKKVHIRMSGSPFPGGGTMGVVEDITNRKKQDSIYQKLVENMHEGVWTCDNNDRVIYANPTFCKMSGYSLGELNTMTEFDLWTEETGERVRNINNNERKKGASSSYEATLVTKSGKEIELFVSGTPLENGSTMGIFTDITELKKQKTMYKNLVENINEAVWMGDKDENTVYANPKFCEMMEYNLEEIIGKSAYPLWEKDSAKKVKDVNKNFRHKGLSSSYEAALLTKSQKKIPVLVSGSPLPDKGTIAVMTDLTAIKEKEKTEEILSNALRYTRNAIIVFDTKGKIQLWNKGAKIIFGYTKQEMENASIEEIFEKKEVQNILENPKILHNLELLGRHKNNDALAISATLTPLTEEKNAAVSAYMLIARDITHQMKFEEELALKYQKLKEAYNEFGIMRRQMDYVFDLIALANKENQDERTVLDFIVNATTMLTRVDACILRKYNPKKDTIEMVAASGVSPDWWGNANLAYKQSLTSKAVKIGHPLKIIDLYQEPKYTSKFLTKKHGFSSLLIIPLFYQEEFIGSLSLFVRPDKKLEIFENEFIEKYAHLIEYILGDIFK